MQIFNIGWVNFKIDHVAGWDKFGHVGGTDFMWVYMMVWWRAFRQVYKQWKLTPCRSVLTCIKESVTTSCSIREWSSGQFTVHPEVVSALESGDPVVALETTIVTHGMPHPHNLETALAVEEAVRGEGAVPASIGVMDGVVHVGLTPSQLERLSLCSSVQKISRGDLAYSLSQNCSGGTTVAGTMVCAHKAGIPIFVTGGVGGVHREGENTMDISTDLTELGRTPVAVVCAGVKSILDVERTLEYLETQGVAVMSLGGDEGVFPSFFTADSGHKAAHHVSSSLQAAKIIDASLEFGVGSGLLFGVPIPPEASCLGEEVEQAVQQALAESRNNGIVGKEITPYVLQRINELTSGKSLQANIELIKNNSRVGSQIAVELSKLRRQRKKATALRICREENSVRKGQVVVIGASVLDFTAKLRSPHIQKEGTNPGSITSSFGGVGRNIAECMSRLGSPPLFLSAIGKDYNGVMMCDGLAKCGLSLTGVYRPNEVPTATYCLVMDYRGDFCYGIADMDINKQLSVDWVRKFSGEILKASYVCVDSNIPEETMDYVFGLCSTNNVPVWFEPTCISKSLKPFLINCQHHIATTSPNLLELRNMYHTFTNADTSTTPPSELTLEEKLLECKQLVKPLLSQIPIIIVSLSKDGVLFCSRRREGKEMVCLHYPAASNDLLPVSVISASGAGDSFVGSVLTGLSSDLSYDLSIKAGLISAYLSLQSITAVSSKLNPELLEVDHIREWAPWDATRIL